MNLTRTLDPHYIQDSYCWVEREEADDGSTKWWLVSPQNDILAFGEEPTAEEALDEGCLAMSRWLEKMDPWNADWRIP